MLKAFVLMLLSLSFISLPRDAHRNRLRVRLPRSDCRVWRSDRNADVGDLLAAEGAADLEPAPDSPVYENLHLTLFVCLAVRGKT
jgi:hypothetical protein